MQAIMRSILFYFIMVSLSIAVCLVLLILSPFMSYAKRLALIAKCSYFLVQCLRVLCGIRYRITGLENVDVNQPMVIASNHQSDWETFFLMTLEPPTSVVLKKQLLYIPFFGWALKLIKPIVINRADRTNALKQLINQGKSYLATGHYIVIFPEGTRIKTGALGVCNKGAAILASQANVPILPIVHNSGSVNPAKSWIKKPAIIDVCIGAPIEPSNSAKMHAQMVSWLEENLAALPD